MFPVAMLRNLDILMLGHSKTPKENAYIFLISYYVLYTHSCFKHEEQMSISGLKSYLKEAYSRHINMNLPLLGVINF